jgi:uncharacterized protein YcfJ
MNRRNKILLGLLAATVSAQAFSQITFYEGEDFRGRAFTTGRETVDFRRQGFNDRASSVIVDSGRWEVCEDAAFRGTCVVLRPGSYDSLKRMGVNNRVSSVRRVSGSVRAQYYEAEPMSEPVYEYRRRPSERTYEARVTSVRAVMGAPEQRCWVESEEVEKKGKRSVGGAILGGVIGGVIGHQIGNGTGQDIATAGGAVAGAAVGSNVGRDKDVYSRDVRRCEVAQNGDPDYWDVRYNFRNVEHRVQLSSPPGSTITVNNRGEPRG